MAAGAVFKSDAVLTFERTLLQVVSQLKIQGFDMKQNAEIHLLSQVIS